MKKLLSVIEILIIVDFYEEVIFVDKSREHCLLTGKDREPAHRKCQNNVKKKQGNFIPFAFPNCKNYDCQLFCKKLVDKEID